MIRIVLFVAIAVIIVGSILYFFRWKFYRNGGADSLRFLSVSDVIEILDKYKIADLEWNYHDKRSEAYMKIRAKAVSFKQLGEIVKKRIGAIYDDFDC